ncbi:hypothetical protein PAPYR_13260 [Paratrimastix pyriformis]|uniref:Uncharacterized protein n=1 Tax=Paratrimastix pyriformis TaxID=342808 RepID=A0ABQ8U5E9_9EUKA|nr:hypothetical protein PAPYR_13260 [Paratrimastix pyriformis]
MFRLLRACEAHPCPAGRHEVTPQTALGPTDGSAAGPPSSPGEKQKTTGGDTGAVPGRAAVLVRMCPELLIESRIDLVRHLPCGCSPLHLLADSPLARGDPSRWIPLQATLSVHVSHAPGRPDGRLPCPAGSAPHGGRPARGRGGPPVGGADPDGHGLVDGCPEEAQVSRPGQQAGMRVARLEDDEAGAGDGQAHLLPKAATATPASPPLLPPHPDLDRQHRGHAVPLLRRPLAAPLGCRTVSVCHASPGLLPRGL